MEHPHEVLSYEDKKIPTKDVKEYQVLERTSHPEKVNAGNKWMYKQPKDFQ